MHILYLSLYILLTRSFTSSGVNTFLVASLSNSLHGYQFDDPHNEAFKPLGNIGTTHITFFDSQLTDPVPFDLDLMVERFDFAVSGVVSFDVDTAERNIFLSYSKDSESRIIRNSLENLLSFTEVVQVTVPTQTIRGIAYDWIASEHALCVSFSELFLACFPLKAPVAYGSVQDEVEETFIHVICWECAKL